MPLTDGILSRSRELHFRGKARLLNAVVPRSGIKTARVFGSLFELDLADHIQRHIYMGAFEPRETRLAKKHLRPGMTCVDVGANVGYYTALTAQAVGPSGCVVAFEPSPYAFERLHGMIARNELEHV